MQGNNSAFLYDEVSLKLLRRSISTERLAPYEELADNNAAYAIYLYEWNTRVSESLYGIIQGFEVALRNAIHEVMSEHYKSEDWYETAPLLAEQRAQIEQAKKRIAKDGRSVTPGRFVAELMFGFWTALAGTDYAQSLWDKSLYRAFRGVRVGRKQAAERLKKIRFLRNRVAHHESIIGRIGHERDLRQDTKEILEAIGWICPTTAIWVAHTTSFDEQYAKRPFNPNDQEILLPM